MNLFSKAAIAAAAVSLTAAPVVASAAPVAFESARATSTVDGESKFQGSTWLYAVLAIAAIVGIILLVDDGDDEPVSP